MDQNDQWNAGTLNEDPTVGARPMNDAARAKTAEGRPAYTEKELIGGAIDRALAPKDKGSFLTTGNYLLDDATDGFSNGQVWLVGGSTSVGKSSWAVSVSDTNMLAGKRVAIVTGEDSAEVYGERFLARRARVSAYRLRTGSLNKDEIERVHGARKGLRDSYVLINGIGRYIEQTMKERVVPILSEVDMVIVDYVQAFRAKNAPQDARRLMVNEVGRVATDVIKGAGKTGVLLSQLTIEKAQQNRLPTKYDIRDSQDLVNGAEVIALLFKPTADIEGENPGRDVNGRKLQAEVAFEAEHRYLILDKNKRGIRGTYELAWNEESACFMTQPDPNLGLYDDLNDDLRAADWDQAAE